MKPLVTLERHGDVAVIVIDNPPVNALSIPLRRDLLAAVQEVAADKILHAAVIACAGRTFIAGADIREFDQPPPDITTGTLNAAIEASAKPFVAALHGTALGGGFELALACHARILAPDSSVGLPESRIGLIPGAGGTQRAPRLAGAMAALDLVTTGRHLQADEALKLGLVDEIATDLRRVAIERARALAAAGALPRARDRAVPDIASAEARAAFDAAVAAAARRARGAIAPVAAAEAVGWALDLPFDEALERERLASLALRTGPQSRALRYLFHAERMAARLPPGPGHDAKPWPVQRCGVIGGGTMGAGIAIALADAGLEVTLVEASAEAARAAESRICLIYERQVKGKRLTEAALEDRMGRIRFTTDLGSLAEAALVVEAIIEDLGAKRDVFRRLAPLVRRDCVLASNTSYLDIDLLADVVDAPERVLGLHFFSPAHVMKLLEIVRGGRTAPEALATALALARRIGKVPVIAGVCEGFIGNRIFSRWRQQCDFLLEDGAYPQDVDAALEAYGFAMGPVRGGRPGRARHRLGNPQAFGPGARPTGAVCAGRRLDLRTRPLRAENRRRLLPPHEWAAGGGPAGDGPGRACLVRQGHRPAGGDGGGNRRAGARRHGERGGENPRRGHRPAALGHRRGAGQRLRLSVLARRTDARGGRDRSRRDAAADRGDPCPRWGWVGSGAVVARNGECRAGIRGTESLIGRGAAPDPGLK